MKRIAISIVRITLLSIMGSVGFSGYASGVDLMASSNRAPSMTQASSPSNQDPRAAAVTFLNTANAQQLSMRLGISRGTAAQIISNRPYADVNQLHAKKIVGLAEFQRIERRLGLRP